MDQWDSHTDPGEPLKDYQGPEDPPYDMGALSGTCRILPGPNNNPHGSEGPPRELFRDLLDPLRDLQDPDTNLDYQYLGAPIRISFLHPEKAAP